MIQSIILQFSSDIPARNTALRTIGDEIEAAFNVLQPGLGTRIIDEARPHFTSTPISFGIDINEFAPQQSGSAWFTLVWGALEDDRTDPPTVYGYYLDFLMDLSGTTITVQQFKNAVRNRWDQIPKRRVLLEAWKRARNGDTRAEIDVTDTPTAQVALVDPEFPKHSFATRPEPVLVEELT